MQESIPDFWTLFKDYLPILAGFITLTSAGVFGFLLSDLKTMTDETASKSLNELLVVQENLTKSKQLTSKDKGELDDIIYDLKKKAFEEKLQIAKRKSNHFSDKFSQGFLLAFGLSTVLVIIEVAAYWVFIDSISKQNYIGLAIFLLAFLGIIEIHMKYQDKPDRKGLKDIFRRSKKTK